MHKIFILFCYTCAFQCVAAYNQWPPPLRRTRNIIHVRTRGFMPYESDILLPLGILKHLQAQQQQQHQRRIARLIKEKQNMQSNNNNNKAATLYLNSGKAQLATTTTTKSHPNAMRLEHRQVGQVNKYNLYDDNGEFLLDVQFHNAGGNEINSKRNKQLLPPPSRQSQPQTQAHPLFHRFPPSHIVSSSPRPLPLRSYLIAEKTATATETETAKLN